MLDSLFAAYVCFGMAVTLAVGVRTWLAVLVTVICWPAVVGWVLYDALRKPGA